MPIDNTQVEQLAASGFHIALQVGFAFPLIEINEWPGPWVKYYTEKRFVLADPVMRWVYSNVGSTRWSEISVDDPERVLMQASMFGLRFGAAVSYRDAEQGGTRSFGSFARQDREFDDQEVVTLFKHVKALHLAKAPPRNLTRAELEALDMMRRGLRQKEIAYDLGVTEGAIKQRLRNAKDKLGAKTAAQAASMAHEFGLI